MSFVGAQFERMFCSMAWAKWMNYLVAVNLVTDSREFNCMVKRVSSVLSTMHEFILIVNCVKSLLVKLLICVDFSYETGKLSSARKAFEIPFG